MKKLKIVTLAIALIGAPTVALGMESKHFAEEKQLRKKTIQLISEERMGNKWEIPRAKLLKKTKEGWIKEVKEVAKKRIKKFQEQEKDQDFKEKVKKMARFLIQRAEEKKKIQQYGEFKEKIEKMMHFLIQETQEKEGERVEKGKQPEEVEEMIKKWSEANNGSTYQQVPERQKKETKEEEERKKKGIREARQKEKEAIKQDEERKKQVNAKRKKELSKELKEKNKKRRTEEKKEELQTQRKHEKQLKKMITKRTNSSKS